MANTLKDDMKADFAALMLNEDEFAETATFYPANGDASRQIVMHLSRVQNAEDGVAVQSDSDTLIARVLKDSSHAKGGIPIEELESGLRPTLAREADFNWEQHFTDQIDDRLVASPTGTYKNLFAPAYANGGANTWNTSCWATGLNVSGLSPYNDADSRKAGVVISRRHLLFIWHTGFALPAVGTEMFFVDPAGNEVTRTLDRTYLLASRFGVGYLDEELPDDIPVYPILPDDWDDYFTLTGLPVVICDQEEKALVGVVVDETYDLAIGHATEYNAGASPRDNYWEDMVEGDSGHPTFLAVNSDPNLILLGVHYAIAEDDGSRLFELPVHTWYNEINAAMTAIDTDDTGYQLTHFDLTRPTPGRFVFTGDILSETPHSWNLRFIRAKGYRTGGGTRRS